MRNAAAASAAIVTARDDAAVVSAMRASADATAPDAKDFVNASSTGAAEMILIDMISMP